MEAFEPLINLLVLMTTLSIAAERLANAIKPRRLAPYEQRPGTRDEKERERQIARRALVVSVLLAAVVKADFFAIVSHLKAPWETLGWVHAGATGASLGQVVQVVSGTLVTGIALGFGSKFWHDALDIVYGARNTLRRARPERDT